MADYTLDFHGTQPSWLEAKQEFLDLYHRALRQSGSKRRSRIDVVHGYGSTGEGGVIRDSLRDFLATRLKYLEYRPGEVVDNNSGHTIVIPRLPIPDYEYQRPQRARDSQHVSRSPSVTQESTVRRASSNRVVENEILGYCSESRTMHEIHLRLNGRLGQSQLSALVWSLIAERKLITGTSNGKLVFRSPNKST